MEKKEKSDFHFTKKNTISLLKAHILSKYHFYVVHAL